MSSNENEDPLQNTTEKHVLKGIEKKVHNSPHNDTESNTDVNEEFFDDDSSIPDESSMTETEASGKEPSPHKDNTTLENDSTSGNKEQNDSILELDVMENKSNDQDFTNLVDDTNNLSSKNNVVDMNIKQTKIEMFRPVHTYAMLVYDIITFSMKFFDKCAIDA